MMPDLSRRRWFQGVALSALIAAGKRARAAENAHRKFTMDLVCSNIGVKATLPEAIALASRHGFESVAPDGGYLKTLSDRQIGELKGELRSRGLTWGAAGLPVDFRGGDSSFREGLKSLPDVARALKESGAERMGTWISPAHDHLTYRANFRQHAARLREVARILHDHGVRLGLEYVGPKTSWSASRYPFVHTMVEARELIEEINVPGVGLVLDSWHWYTAHEKPEDLLSLKGSDVVACDLNDAPAGIPVDEQKDLVRDLPCATGVINLKSFLNSLVTIGYDGPVRAEPFKAELRRLPPEKALTETSAAMKKAFSLVG
jgi:sugar phosphate isomerase/epimerase